MRIELRPVSGVPIKDYAAKELGFELFTYEWPLRSDEQIKFFLSGFPHLPEEIKSRLDPCVIQ